MRSSPPPAGRAAAAVAFFGYLLNVVTTLLTASGPKARKHEAIQKKMQACGLAGYFPRTVDCSDMHECFWLDAGRGGDNVGSEAVSRPEEQDQDTLLGTLDAP